MFLLGSINALRAVCHADVGPRWLVLQGRCAAVALFNHQLALLPAEGNDMLDLLVQETGAADGPTASAALQTSYIVNLQKALGILEVFLGFSISTACRLVHPSSDFFQPFFPDAYTKHHDLPHPLLP